MQSYTAVCVGGPYDGSLIAHWSETMEVLCCTSEGPARAMIVPVYYHLQDGVWKFTGPESN